MYVQSCFTEYTTVYLPAVLTFTNGKKDGFKEHVHSLIFYSPINENVNKPLNDWFILKVQPVLLM
jgi:hypothetical protein